MNIRSHKFLLILTVVLIIRIPLDIFEMSSLSERLKPLALLPSPQPFKSYPSLEDQKKNNIFEVQVNLKGGESQIYPYFQKAYNPRFSYEKKIALIMSSRALVFKSGRHQQEAQKNVKNLICNDVVDIKSFTMGSVELSCQ